MFLVPLTPPTAPFTSLASPLARKMERVVRDLSYSAAPVNDEHSIPSWQRCPLVQRGRDGREWALTTHPPCGSGTNATRDNGAGVRRRPVFSFILWSILP